MSLECTPLREERRAFPSSCETLSCAWCSSPLLLLVQPLRFEVLLPRSCLSCFLYAFISYLRAIVFFFAATAPLRGPLRVRALVCVRCPRTGRFRRWRSPR